MSDRPSVEEVREWIGYRLDEGSGAGVGRVEGAYVDERGGGVEWLLVRQGRLGALCLVPAREAVGAAGHVWVPWDRATIRTSPEVDATAPLAAGRELELCAHYGIGGAMGRAGELAARPGSDVTSRRG
jgi:hypothetical protein